MIATVVFVDVIPDKVDEFIKITQYNHENSRKEPGNVRFDVLRDNKNPSRFLLYEVYEDEGAASAHKETEHYRQWRDTVAPMMAQPRTSVPTTPLFFD